MMPRHAQDTVLTALVFTLWRQHLILSAHMMPRHAQDTVLTALVFTLWRQHLEDLLSEHIIMQVSLSLRHGKSLIMLEVMSLPLQLQDVLCVKYSILGPLPLQVPRETLV